METITDLKAKEYDLDTMTTGDFSVSYQISSNMYHNFLDQQSENILRNDGSIAKAFKQFLKIEIERVLIKFCKDQKKLL